MRVPWKQSHPAEYNLSALNTVPKCTELYCNTPLRDSANRPRSVMNPVTPLLRVFVRFAYRCSRAEGTAMACTRSVSVRRSRYIESFSTGEASPRLANAIIHRDEPTACIGDGAQRGIERVLSRDSHIAGRSQRVPGDKPPTGSSAMLPPTLIRPVYRPSDTERPVIIAQTEEPLQVKSYYNEIHESGMTSV